jgi:1,4-dihydroxy-6-naphthoate synthase
MSTTTDHDKLTLHLGHSPDPDDAFMWFPLANFSAEEGPSGKAYTPAIDTGRFDFKHVLEDIQSLNDRCENGELEITALSIHQYPYVADKYAMTSCGSSMGDGYGPMIVASKPMQVTDLIGKGGKSSIKLAIPGLRTSAWLATQLRLMEEVGKGAPLNVNYQVVAFDEIIQRVVSGEFDAGLIIHEGQLTFGESGLHCVVDLGKWWTESRGVPLPLGGNAIRRDLGEQTMREICTVLLASINYALTHREESVAYALNYARDMGADLADRFVGMYVNNWTLDYGDTGRAAVRQFLKEAADAGLVPDPGEIDFVDPA